MRRAERPILFDTPAGFDDPLEMLLGCHRRIEKQLQTLKKLRAHIAARGVDAEASTAAQAVLRYFQMAAPNHHADEERDLLPLLETRITDPDASARFKAFRETLEADHRKLEIAWSRLRKPLEGIAEGLTRALPAADVNDFVDAYTHHIALEDGAFKEFFARWVNDADRMALGRSMAARRTTSPPLA